MEGFAVTGGFHSGRDEGSFFRARVTQGGKFVAQFQIPIEDFGRFLKGEIYIPCEFAMRAEPEAIDG